MGRERPGFGDAWSTTKARRAGTSTKNTVEAHSRAQCHQRSSTFSLKREEFSLQATVSLSQPIFWSPRCHIRTGWKTEGYTGLNTTFKILHTHFGTQLE